MIQRIAEFKRRRPDPVVPEAVEVREAEVVTAG